MAIAAPVKYTVRFHVDTNPASAGFDKNIIFDGIDVENFNDGSFATHVDPTAAVVTIEVGNEPTVNQDSFAVITAYPQAYASGDPKAMTVAGHVQTAFALVQAIINAVPFVGFPGGGPEPVILTLSAITTPGTGYPDGTFYNVPLTGGSGYRAKATITVAGGAVTVCTLTDPGVLYVAGDVLSANLGVSGNTYPAVPGSGFTITVATVGSNLTNTLY
jgi:hypothetical protein